MEGVAEKVANGMGTVGFVVAGTLIIIAWIFINGGVPYAEHTITALSHGGQYDPEPWILLNLIFSGVAFYTGALVIIAQKSEAKKNSARELAEAKHREEIAAENMQLLKSNTQLTVQIHRLAKIIVEAVPGAELPPETRR